MEPEQENETPAPARRRGRPPRKTQEPAAQPDPLEQPETPATALPEEFPPRSQDAPRPIDLPRIAVFLAFVAFLFSQLAGLRQGAESMEWQARNLDRQMENLRTARENVAGLVQQRQAVVDQAQRVTSSYNELFNDLLRLAETDKDARAVVEKFQIKSAAPPPPPK